MRTSDRVLYDVILRDVECIEHARCDKPCAFYWCANSVVFFKQGNSVSCLCDLPCCVGTYGSCASDNDVVGVRCGHMLFRVNGQSFITEAVITMGYASTSGVMCVFFVVS